MKVKAIDDPNVNIRAGILYALSRFASFANKSIDDPVDKKEYSYAVLPGDNLDKIAGKVGTTVEVLQTMNPSARGMIQPKRVLIYKKASIKLVITSWTPVTTSGLAQRYNGGGDPTYAEKLNMRWTK